VFYMSAQVSVQYCPAMLEHARRRADQHGISADLRIGDAQDLALPEAAFDTGVCTFSLCAIPDDRRAVAEMIRVLRPVVCCCWPIMSPAPAGRSAPCNAPWN
jgi:ubiquinone/menaquinone biosynthesis C-methylase UbiE